MIVLFGLFCWLIAAGSLIPFFLGLSEAAKVDRPTGVNMMFELIPAGIVFGAGCIAISLGSIAWLLVLMREELEVTGADISDLLELARSDSRERLDEANRAILEEIE